jgi:hypothetical protein
VQTITTFIDCSISLRRLRSLLSQPDADVSCMSQWSDELLASEKGLIANSVAAEPNRHAVNGSASSDSDVEAPPDLTALQNDNERAPLTINAPGPGKAVDRGRRRPSLQLHQQPVLMSDWVDLEAIAATLPSRARPNLTTLDPSASTASAPENRSATVDLKSSSRLLHPPLLPAASGNGTFDGNGVAHTQRQQTGIDVVEASLGWWSSHPSGPATAAVETATGNNKGRVKIVLHGVSFRCRPHSLTLVLGGVGTGETHRWFLYVRWSNRSVSVAGKSTLLAALVGDADRAAGRIRVTGSIAYAGQTAWVSSRCRPKQCRR